MENDKKKNKRVYKAILLALIPLQGLSLFKIYQLDRRLSEEISNRQMDSLSLSRDIESIYDNVNYIQLTESSILEDLDYKIGDIDFEKLTVDMEFTALPKEVGPDTRVFIDFQGDRLELKREDRYFKANFQQDIFSSLKKPEIIIVNGEKQETSRDFRLDDVDIKERVFRNFRVDYQMISSSYGSDSYEYHALIDCKINDDQAYPRFKEAQLEILIDDSLVKSEKVGMDELNKGYEIYENFPLKDKEIIETKLVLIDSLDLKHEYLLERFNKKDKNQLINGVEELIYSKEGKLLYDSRKDAINY